MTQAVEVRFARRLTRIPDLIVIRSDELGRHWFAPGEVVVAIKIESPGNHVEDRTTKPAIYGKFGIPHYWRIEPDPLRATIYRLGAEDKYREIRQCERLRVSEPFELDIPLAELLPSWARRH